MCTNPGAVNLLGVLSKHNRDILTRQLRIATGERTIVPEDGAAFHAISKKVENDVRAKEMAIDNAGDAKDMLSLAEAGLHRISELVSSYRDLVVRAGNDTLTDEQRDDVNLELETIAMAIDEITARTNFNETGPMLDGTFEATFQVGPSELDTNKLKVKIGDFSAKSLGLDPESIRIRNNTDTMMALTEIDEAFGRIQDQLIRLGGIQSELTGLENILSGSIPPEEAIQSLYGDADIAQEQVALTQLQLFSQLATGQVAASNAQSGQILSLLR
jgi:flagellin